MSKVRDQLLLLVAAIACAGFANLLFRVLGDHAFPILLGVVSLAVTADNARLRRELKNLKKQQEQSNDQQS